MTRAASTACLLPLLATKEWEEGRETLSTLPEDFSANPTSLLTELENYRNRLLRHRFRPSRGWPLRAFARLQEAPSGAAPLMGKGNNQQPTTNIQHPTSNIQSSNHPIIQSSNIQSSNHRASGITTPAIRILAAPPADR